MRIRTLIQNETKQTRNRRSNLVHEKCGAAVPPGTLEYSDFKHALVKLEDELERLTLK